MRKITLLFTLIFCAFQLCAQPVQNTYQYDLNYFIPESFTKDKKFDPSIPQPKDILGFEIGEQFVEWADVLRYMYALDAASDRVSIKTFGKTYQNRPFIQVIITSEENQKKLDQIKEEHLKLTEADQHGNLDISKMPVVVCQTNSIHGNESSGVNSSLVAAYFYAASLDEEIVKLLDNTVFVLIPGLNPDGINRFATWVNTTHSYIPVSDLRAREFTEPWPSSRVNHYWADCNRDWLMLQHPEGQNAVSMYMEWIPNVLSDHHEMSGDIKGFYFSPGHPKRTHEYIPQENQDLTYEITKYTAGALDKIGSHYFSKEGYDDFYLGKGAAYGDVQGTVGILYEQVAPRGYVRPVPYGTISFPYSVRNQAFAAIMTVYASYNMKDKLLEYQKNFYKNTRQASAKDPLKGYIFNTRGRRAIEYHFLKNMAHHQIDVYKLRQNTTQGGKEFKSEDSYVIPLNQKSYWKIKGIWENITEFSDSLFYDISTWTFPHAFNLKYAKLSSTAGLLGDRVEKVEFPSGQIIGGKAKYAYVFENTELYSHNLISDLLKKGVFVRISKKPFHYTENGVSKEFGYGTAVVQLQNQPLNEDELYEVVNESATRNGIDVYAFNTGLMDDFDLGTPGNKGIKMPKVALVTGRGMGIPDSGEIWFMLDRRFGIPPVLIDFNTLHKADLSKYNVIILANGSPSVPVSQSAYAKLKAWVKDGGVLIATGSAYSLTNEMGITDFKKLPSLKLAKTAGDSPFKPYRTETSSALNNVEGVILNCTLDLTSPLGYGYKEGDVALLKKGSTAFDMEKTSADVPMYYTAEPYLSGCMSKRNIERFAHTPACLVSGYGDGRVIYFSDDLNFRSYWFGATKIFMNAIFFGQLY